MRKRSKYRPKPVLQDPVNYVLTGIKPVVKVAPGHHAAISIKANDAIGTIRRGQGRGEDTRALIACFNMAEAFCRLGLGAQYLRDIEDGHAAVEAIVIRAKQTGGRMVAAGTELQALVRAVAVHDAQLDDPACTVVLMERAIALVAKEHRAGRVRLVRW